MATYGIGTEVSWKVGVQEGALGVVRDARDLEWYQHGRHVCTPREAVSEQGRRERACAF